MKPKPEFEGLGRAQPGLAGPAYMRNAPQVLLDVLVALLCSHVGRLSARRRRAATAATIMLLLDGLDSAERAVVLVDVSEVLYEPADRQH